MLQFLPAAASWSCPKARAGISTEDWSWIQLNILFHDLFHRYKPACEFEVQTTYRNSPWGLHHAALQFNITPEPVKSPAQLLATCHGPILLSMKSLLIFTD